MLLAWLMGNRRNEEKGERRGVLGEEKPSSRCLPPAEREGERLVIQNVEMGSEGRVCDGSM